VLAGPDSGFEQTLSTDRAELRYPLESPAQASLAAAFELTYQSLD
jgi:hypothetical protein